MRILPLKVKKTHDLSTLRRGMFYLIREGIVNHDDSITFGTIHDPTQQPPHICWCDPEQGWVGAPYFHLKETSKSVMQMVYDCMAHCRFTYREDPAYGYVLQYAGWYYIFAVPRKIREFNERL